ncbi:MULTISPECIES: RNA polymerase sigma factor [unclassified Sporosarcina]|uniref:RNA polymerase sigma factor n=1 Tax=unclassified Sporosarcina TaxID=2647733 RepID=UPI002040197C|nr:MULTISPECIES: sigma-70 family RNA polymerase sigma factor [unclassified Sporosarcina]GKV67064.1 RNA polymerase sigma factor YlaC [Sporosarcina sp. NCCP-2331]GLB57394.1 RNA polymerase sigma factor YlaC [Sporosarcina sp. NCCP-2378]
MDQEKKWIKQLQKNIKASAANDLVAKYYKEIYAFSYKQTLDVELSLDLTQDIFMGALQSIHQYNDKKASFRTWLYKIASNRLVDYYRSKSYRYAQLAQPMEDDLFEDEYDMTLSLEYKEDYARAAAYINKLDARSQQVVRLKLFGEYTLQEIAEIEDLPLSTVKTRYYSALRWIRSKMEANHLE